MSLAPLLDATPVIAIHAVAAMAAFGLGVLQLVAPKGTLPHRTVGYIWCGLMLLVAASSFRIHAIDQWRGFSLIHLLSILVLIQVPVAIHLARRHHVSAHGKTMIGLFAGALVVAGLFAFMPGRIMHAVLFGS